MAAYQDYTSAGHASTACNRQPIASLPSDSVCFSESYRAPDPSLPYGILHAAWVNSRTGLWGPRGSQDPELDAVPAQEHAQGDQEEDPDREDVMLFQTGRADHPRDPSTARADVPTKSSDFYGCPRHCLAIHHV